jgi:hypothetical protein
MKRLVVICLAVGLVVSLTTAALAWRGGGAVYRGPNVTAVRGPYGGGAIKGPNGNVAARGPTNVYGGVYRAPVATGVAVGVAIGAAATATPYYPPPYYAPSCGYYPNPPC